MFSPLATTGLLGAKRRVLVVSDYNSEMQNTLEIPLE